MNASDSRTSTPPLAQDAQLRDVVEGLAPGDRAHWMRIADRRRVVVTRTLDGAYQVRSSAQLLDGVDFEREGLTYTDEVCMHLRTLAGRSKLELQRLKRARP